MSHLGGCLALEPFSGRQMRGLVRAADCGGNHAQHQPACIQSRSFEQGSHTEKMLRLLTAEEARRRDPQ
jgi:hypothetical protein